MKIMRKLWWGLYPLPRTFWGFYVLGFFGVWLMVGVPTVLLAAHFPDLRPYFLLAGAALLWTYWAVASVGVWRSANDSKHYIAFWRYSAKVVIFIYAFTVAKSIVHAFSVH